jgi:hypothetical protein
MGAAKISYDNNEMIDSFKETLKNFNIVIPA